MIVTHVFGVERVRYYHARLSSWDIRTLPVLAFVLRDVDIAHDYVMIHDGLRGKHQPTHQLSESDRLTEVSSKKKRLTGRLAKYVILDSGSCAFANRADKRVISKVKSSGPLNVEPIAALVETLAWI